MDPDQISSDGLEALNAINHPVFLSDDQGNVFFANTACQRLAGRGATADDAVEMLQQSIQAVASHAPATSAGQMSATKQTITVTTPALTTHQFERRSTDGGPFNGLDTWVEHADAAEEQRFKAVVNTAVDGIVIIDSKGRIESFNPAAEKIFGYKSDEIIGQYIERLMPSPFRENHQEYLDKYMRTGETAVIGQGREVKGLRKDGTVFPLDLAVNEVGHLGLFVGVVRDITQRRRSEEQLRQADRLASIGSLAAGLGHDMNNVLLPIRGRLDALEGADLPATQRHHVRAIGESVHYLQQLSDGLHLLALDPRQENVSSEFTDIHEWWDQVGPLLQRSLPRNVRLDTTFDADVNLIPVAPHRLTQVVLNLLINAGDAVADEGIVSVTAGSTDQNNVCLAVSDNGAGMPDAVRERATEAFYTTKGRERGTGLGLALVRGIVIGAGGTLDIDSELGKGTTVSCSFPVAQHDLAAQDHPEQPAPRAALISLEDERIASMIASVLQDGGLHVSYGQRADPTHHAIWITAPGEADISAVQQFLKTPGRQVIACGDKTGDWARIGTLVIDDVFNFEQIRGRIGAAITRVSTTQQ